MSPKNKKVIENLKNRQKKPKDRRKIGLIVEGGGMRGVFAGGALLALEELGHSSSFDILYASSSGSCASAYFLSGETQKGLSVYLEDLTGFKFIKPWRLTKIMDIDFLVDEVFRKRKRLNQARLKNNRTELKIYVTDAETGKPECFTNRDGVNILKVIKASCALPIWYNRAVKVGNITAVDGNALKALPIDSAITDGCTDLLVISTVPKYYREATGRKIVRAIKRQFLSTFSYHYRQTYSQKYADYNESLDIIFGKKRIHGKLNLYTICPDNFYQTFELRKSFLEKAALEGKEKVLEAFG